MEVIIRGFTPSDNKNSEEYRIALLQELHELDAKSSELLALYAKYTSSGPAVLLFAAFSALLLTFSGATAGSSIAGLVSVFGIGGSVIGLLYVKEYKSKAVATERSLAYYEEQQREAKSCYDYALKNRDKDGKLIYIHSGVGSLEKIYDGSRGFTKLNEEARAEFDVRVSEVLARCEQAQNFFATRRQVLFDANDDGLLFEHEIADLENIISGVVGEEILESFD